MGALPARFFSDSVNRISPSQTIGMGLYFHGVKKRRNCAVVSFVLGGMS